MAKDTFRKAQHSAFDDGCLRAMKTSPVVLLYMVADVEYPQEVPTSW